MKKLKVLWLICMAGLCLVLYTIVVSRTGDTTDIVFGGVDGAYVSTDSKSFADPNAPETPEPTADIWPKIDDITVWPYTMVREDNLLSSAYEPEVERIEITKYMMFHKDALPQLNAFIQAIQDAGFTVTVQGAYRSYSYQSNLFNGKASQIAAGYGNDDYLDPKYQVAVEEAKKITAFPGSSEHQLGLAVDLLDRTYSKMDYDIMNKEFFEWVDAHCAEYGFIKRYPTRKLLLTGWDEPWHYRYVGVEAATFIMEQGICYEEFYAHYDSEFTY